MLCELYFNKADKNVFFKLNGIHTAFSHNPIILQNNYFQW